MHKCVCHGKNNAIHSSPQIEHYANIVDDTSTKFSSGQHVPTLDNHKITISIRGTLPHIPLRPYNDKERQRLPHIVLILDKDYGPTSID